MEELKKATSSKRDWLSVALAIMFILFFVGRVLRTTNNSVQQPVTPDFQKSLELAPKVNQDTIYEDGSYIYYNANGERVTGCIAGELCDMPRLR